jgi:hypothetical protein
MYSWNRFYEKSGVKRVNLGAGPYFNKSGWISIDMISSEKVAFSSKKFISKRIGVDKLNLSNVDLCYSSHFCEHLNQNLASEIFHEIFQAMNVGGRVRIVVPDAKLILERYLDKDLEWFEPCNPILISDSLSLTLENHVLTLLCQAQINNHFLASGLLLGMGGALYLVWLRFGR